MAKRKDKNRKNTDGRAPNALPLTLSHRSVSLMHPFAGLSVVSRLLKKREVFPFRFVSAHLSFNQKTAASRLPLSSSLERPPPPSTSSSSPLFPFSSFPKTSQERVPEHGRRGRTSDPKSESSRGFKSRPAQKKKKKTERGGEREGEEASRREAGSRRKRNCLCLRFVLFLPELEKIASSNHFFPSFVPHLFNPRASLSPSLFLFPPPSEFPTSKKPLRLPTSGRGALRIRLIAPKSSKKKKLKNVAGIVIIIGKDLCPRDSPPVLLLGSVRR